MKKQILRIMIPAVCAMLAMSGCGAGAASQTQNSTSQSTVASQAAASTGSSAATDASTGNETGTANTSSEAAASQDTAGTTATAGSAASLSASDAQTFTAFLKQVQDKFSADSYAGISLQEASCAAEMMNWYMESKPSAEAVTAAVKSFLSSLDSSTQTALRGGVEAVYDSAKQTTGANGKDLLSTSGYQGSITWAEADVETLFQAILAAFPTE